MITLILLKIFPDIDLLDWLNWLVEIFKLAFLQTVRAYQAKGSLLYLK